MPDEIISYLEASGTLQALCPLDLAAQWGSARDLGKEGTSFLTSNTTKKIW